MLRNRDCDGKLAAARNPIYGYRLYLREDLESLPAAVARSSPAREGAGSPDAKHG